MARRGFSLVELLVVTAIVAVIAALLLPALNLVKESARSARCAAAQRQVGAAMLGYAADWDGVVVPTSRQTWNTNLPYGSYPYGVHWHALLQDYAEGDADDPVANRQRGVIWGCPSWHGRDDGSGGVSAGYTGYGRNFLLAFRGSSEMDSELTAAEWGAPGLFRLFVFQRVAHLSSRILFGDSIDWHLFPDPGQPGIWPAWSGDPRRHGGRAVYLFGDIHVEKLAAFDAWRGVANH